MTVIAILPPTSVQCHFIRKCNIAVYSIGVFSSEFSWFSVGYHKQSAFPLRKYAAQYAIMKKGLTNNVSFIRGFDLRLETSTIWFSMSVWDWESYVFCPISSSWCRWSLNCMSVFLLDLFELLPWRAHPGSPLRQSAQLSIDWVSHPQKKRQCSSDRSTL